MILVYLVVGAGVAWATCRLVLHALRGQWILGEKKEWER